MGVVPTMDMQGAAAAENANCRLRLKTLLPDAADLMYRFHKVCYAICYCSRVHSISKCDMPMISMGSPWRFWNVPTLFAAESD